MVIGSSKSPYATKFEIIFCLGAKLVNVSNSIEGGFASIGLIVGPFGIGGWIFKGGRGTIDGNVVGNSVCLLVQSEIFSNICPVASKNELKVDEGGVGETSWDVGITFGIVGVIIICDVVVVGGVTGNVVVETGEYGNLINFNNCDWSMTFVLSTFRIGQYNAVRNMNLVSEEIPQEIIEETNEEPNKETNENTNVSDLDFLVKTNPNYLIKAF